MVSTETWRIACCGNPHTWRQRYSGYRADLSSTDYPQSGSTCGSTLSPIPREVKIRTAMSFPRPAVTRRVDNSFITSMVSSYSVLLFEGLDGLNQIRLPSNSCGISFRFPRHCSSPGQQKHERPTAHVDGLCFSLGSAAGLRSESQARVLHPWPGAGLGAQAASPPALQRGVTLLPFCLSVVRGRSFTHGSPQRRHVALVQGGVKESERAEARVREEFLPP